MILGSVFLLTAAVVLVVLLVRMSGGRPGAVERFTLSGGAIALIIAGSGMFAIEFLASDRTEAAQADPVEPNTPVAQLPAQSEPISEQLGQQLKWMHRSSVEIFIDRPGFGMRRMEMPLQDVVTPPKLTSDSASLSQGQQSELELAKLETALNRLPKGREAHYAIRDVLNSFGRMPSGEGEVWDVRSLQLVGLVKNPKPVVYESNKMPGMKDVKDLPTRDLNVFESRALESLRGGQQMIAEKTGKQIHMMAPIFAGNRCLTCHSQKGQMLGAFSYVIESVPMPKVEPAVNNEP